MREIKIEVMFYIYNSSMAKVIKKHYTTVDRLCKSNEFFKQDLEIICTRQFTNVIDMDKSEIYDGDILSDGKSLYQVDIGGYYSESSVGFGVNYSKGGDASKFSIEPNPFGAESKLRVVGNIYENPELLESK